jgi:non-specific serine/threonine protein kinase
MLETIHAYARETLAERGETARLQGQHAAYFLGVAEQAAPHLMGPEKGVWLARLEAEHDNLRAALRWAVESGAAAQGLRLGAALWRFWQIHGHFGEGRAWLERLLALHAGAMMPDVAAARATALIGAGWLAHSQDDFARATALFQESLAVHGHAGGLIDLLVHRAMEARAMGDYVRATALLEESLDRCRAMGDRTSIGGGGLGLCLARLALVLGEQGDSARATALWDECLALHRALGDRSGIAVALLGLGDLARDQDDAAQVRRYCVESLALFRALGEQWGIGFSLNNLTLAAYQDGDTARALALAEESVALFRGLDSGSGLAEVLVTLGRVAGAAGDTDRAQAALAESLALALGHGPRWVVAAVLEDTAALAVAQGQAEQAARCLGAAAALRAAMGTPLPPARRAGHERTRKVARAVGDPQHFDTLWTAGQTAPLEQTIAVARLAVLAASADGALPVARGGAPP